MLFAVLATAVLVAAGPVAAIAQQVPAPNDKGKWVQPPRDLPKSPRGTDPTHNLDFLFEALKVAPDDATAKAVEQRIWAMLMVSPSDTANLLMARVRTAVEGKDTDLALKLLDSIVTIRPDYVEAWNRRATLNFLRKDYGAALADLAQVLRREPRHFGALSGLGLILHEIGDDKRALAAYRRAAEIYPRLENLADQIKKLSEAVEGRDI
ncbi:MAG TPA: tetratricopeptide repeat protein [Pseudolabrys sp.]|nr:tetratricopeptide repeat protein [Pseudolabrys sp.]